MNCRLGFGVAVCSATAFLLAGCMVARQPAPVVERTPQSGLSLPKPGAADPAQQALPPFSYMVKRGDTLYSIAAGQGLDYRDLARWNNLPNPAAIEVGQVLTLKDPEALASAADPAGSAEPSAVATPYEAPPPVEGKSLAQPGDLPSPPGEAAARPDPSLSGVVTSPQALKLPYSQSALAKLQAAPPGGSAPTAPIAPQRQEPAAPSEVDGIAWGWPTKGTVISGFNENGGPKGMHIAGTPGQPIVASAPGRVVYTGSGLRGYGNLVIIKHNETYLSAYAHNRAVLVKQGDSVTKGQKIAEMGDSDASRVMLHFEIRRLGKPVDPSKFLPPA